MAVRVGKSLVSSQCNVFEGFTIVDSQPSVPMTHDRASMSRRSYLSRISGAAVAGVAAGCSMSDDGDPADPTPRESSCSDGDTSAPAIYDDWLLHLEPAEYTASSLTATTVTPPAIARFPGVRDLFRPYLYYLDFHVDRLGFDFSSIDAALYVKPPGDETAAFSAIRNPESLTGRRAWLNRLEFETSVSELSDYRSYARRSVRDGSIGQLAFDDEVVLVAPDESGPVELEAPARIRRLVQTNGGDEHPYHCYDTDVRALLERLPRSDLTYAQLRTDAGTFESDVSTVPSGSRASAISVFLRWKRRELIVGTDGTRSTATDGRQDETTATQSARPTGRSTATPSTPRETPGETAPGPTPTATESGPEEPLADLSVVTVFPEDADEDAVRDLVDDRWSDSGSGESGLAFDDPSYETNGRVVTASETRPVRELVE